MTIPLISVASQLAAKRILDSSRNRLESGLQAFQGQVNKSREMVRALLEEQALIDILLLEGTPTVKHYMEFSEVQRRLQNFAPSQDYLDYTYIVFEKNPIFISSLLSSDYAEKVYPAFFTYTEVSFDDWQEQLFRGPFDTRFYNHVDYKIGEDSPIAAFTYLINMTYYTSIDNSAIMGCVFGKEQMLTAMLAEEIRKESFLWVGDLQGEEILASGTAEDTSLPSNLQGDWLELDGVRYRLVTKEHALLGVKAVLGIPEDLLRQDFQSLLLVASIYFIAGFLLIFSFAFFFSLREARMMRDLLMTASQTTGTLYKPSNEFTYVQNALQCLRDQDQVKLLRIQQLNYQVVVRMLHGLLLQGIYTEKEEAEIHQYFGNRFDCCVVVKLQLLLPDENQESLYQLENVLHQTLHAAFEWVVLPKNEIAVLLFLDQKDNLKEERRVFEDVGKSIPLKAGFSTICTSIYRVREGYLQAQTALQQLPAEEQVGMYQLLPAAAVTPDTAIFRKLYDCILYGEEKDVRDIFSHILKKHPLHTLTLPEQQQLYFSLRQSVIAVLSETITTFSSEEGEQIKNLLNPSGKTILEQLEGLQAATLSLCAGINGRKRSGNTQLKEGILQYLHENFSDSGLCAAKIAEKFSISEKYVYLFVKEQTGQPLGTIIETIRLEEAKKLLISTEYPNRVIAEKTGFGSENTFYRIFSKYHGVSPAVWRKQQKNS